jgi:hypothetical protein
MVAQIAAAARWGNDDGAEARLALKASRLEQHIRLVVASAPPLTEEQRLKLASLLVATEAGR